VKSTRKKKNKYKGRKEDKKTKTHRQTHIRQVHADENGGAEEGDVHEVGPSASRGDRLASRKGERKEGKVSIETGGGRKEGERRGKATIPTQFQPNRIDPRSVRG
jgi:hypothetical protein